jgi:hypothetical protein
MNRIWVVEFNNEDVGWSAVDFAITEEDGKDSLREWQQSSYEGQTEELYRVRPYVRQEESRG